MEKKLIKITTDNVVYKKGNEIIVEPIDTQAKTILAWFNHNIPANN